LLPSPLILELNLLAIWFYLNSCCLQGFSWERERLLHPPRALLRHDSEAE
jgi:hypothetical protein